MKGVYHAKGDACYDPPVEADDLPDELNDAVSALSEDYRKVILLSADGNDYNTIAEKLSIPIGTVMSRLWRARQFLKKRLGNPAA
jgi:RNA polymerase sigma-70 factor (ECF subfamily)